MELEAPGEEKPIVTAQRVQEVGAGTGDWGSGVASDWWGGVDGKLPGGCNPRARFEELIQMRVLV